MSFTIDATSPGVKMVWSGAQQAEEKDGEGQQKKAAHLATAFGLPASC